MSTPVHPSASPGPAGAADVLRWPVIGPFLRWRHARTAAQILLGLVALVVVLHGILGPQLAPRNLATVLSWIHYRGLLVGALLVAGNVFCAACPMVLVRDAARRWHRPVRRWPRWLGLKWVGVVLFALVLFGYELFDLWALPAATAWVVVGYFAAALIVDLTFAGASFCKHVCPVGQFNFVASTISPMEVRARRLDVCRSCRTADCIKGRRSALAPVRVTQRGCELGLFLPTKVGNLDCTFCLDCVHACPYDNVAIGFRVAGDELADGRRRSAIGRLAARPDLASLALLFTFGALLNAFAMVSPVYALEHWIAGAIGATSEVPVLLIVFVAGLVIVPLVLTGAAAWLTVRLAPVPGAGVRDVLVRHAFALVPFGFGVWLAHYGFHFLTSAGTLVPVVQAATIDLVGGTPLGEPDWRWLGLRSGVVYPFQIGSVLLGAMGSLAIVHRIAARDHPGASSRAALPWALLVAGLALLALWILAQPMEMRSTGLAG
jgi:ferredoxin